MLASHRGLVVYVLKLLLSDLPLRHLVSLLFQSDPVFTRRPSGWQQGYSSVVETCCGVKDATRSVSGAAGVLPLTCASPYAASAQPPCLLSPYLNSTPNLFWCAKRALSFAYDPCSLAPDSPAICPASQHPSYIPR